uniref:C2H2-type domain-containing protein n=1 Tax=Oryzias latipes TaxID=8090 RepID=A0A3P9KP03_ORYLA
MPKPPKRSESSKEKHSSATLLLADEHDYSGSSMDIPVTSEEEFPSLPVTPSKPPLAKKPTLPWSMKSDEAVNMLADLINSRSDALEKMVETVQKLLGCSTCGQRFNWVYQLKNHRCENTELNGADDKAETAADEGAASAEHPGCVQSQEESFHVSAPQMLLKDISYANSTKGFTQENHLQAHAGEKGFTCSVCCRVFLWKRQLQRHMRSHAGAPSLSCTACSKTFALPHQLRLHHSGTPGRPTYKNRHRAVRQFPCFQCGKEFGLRDSLMRHLRCHTGEKPFGCSVCGKQFRDRGNMGQHMHMRIHTRQTQFTQTLPGGGGFSLCDVTM